MSQPAPSTDVASTATPAPRPIVHVSHRTRHSTRTLRPWIVHVFQGKPAHQTETAANSSESSAALSTAAIQAPSAAVSLALPSIVESSSAPTSLPFAAPTTKESHNDHDLRILSPEQAAFYANEYGKVEQQLEIASVLDSLRYQSNDGLERRVCEKVVFHQVSILSIHTLVQDLQRAQAELEKKYSSVSVFERDFVPTIVVMNLCDGTETDGYPGVSIAAALSSTHNSTDPSLPPLKHTGADPVFFHTTTDKVTMKQLFHDANPPVRSSRFVDLTSIDCTVPLIDGSSSDLTPHSSLLAALKPLQYPLIIKPTTSYSSCGLTESSVVQDAFHALKQAQLIRKELGDVLAEEFIDGREFSMLIVGDWNGRIDHGNTESSNGTTTAAASSPSSIAPSSPSTSSTTAAASLYPHLRCYSPAERAFSANLPPLSRFLTFEQNYPTKFTEVQTWWQRPEGADVEKEQEQMSLLACSAYIACKGRSYGRIDIRQSSSTGEFFILEVNSLPGISGELDSSVGAILHHSQPPTLFGEFLYAIIHLAAEGHLDQTKDS